MLGDDARFLFAKVVFVWCNMMTTGWHILLDSSIVEKIANTYITCVVRLMFLAYLYIDIISDDMFFPRVKVVDNIYLTNRTIFGRLFCDVITPHSLPYVTLL